MPKIATYLVLAVTIWRDLQVRTRYLRRDMKFDKYHARVLLCLNGALRSF